MINSGNYPLKDEPEFDKIFENVISKKMFSATTNISEAIPNCDIILLSLPTPDQKKYNQRMVISQYTYTIRKHLYVNMLMIISGKEQSKCLLQNVQNSLKIWLN